jgi:hypothetical protein
MPEVGCAKQGVQRGVLRIAVDGILQLSLDLRDLIVLIAVVDLPELPDGRNTFILFAMTIIFLGFHGKSCDREQSRG